jgi:uncharacterized protein with PIN domain
MLVRDPPARVAEFRFYEELNDFLPKDKRKSAFSYKFTGTPSVKDTIEAIGVPHTEIDLILVDGQSVGFGRRLIGGERVAVYPVFERFDISPLVRLRARPLRNNRFILDVHLGKLARYLRLLGFDTLYRNDYDDPALVALSVSEQRILLTRDIGLLKNGALTHGYFLRETRPKSQLIEVLRALDVARALKPFTRCLECNGELCQIDKEEVRHRVPPRVVSEFHEFVECRKCAKVYWQGSHYTRMKGLLEELGVTESL